MRKMLGVIFLVYASFVAEGIFFQFIGRLFNPNILIILIVFFNLTRGIRYSLFAAFVAGIIKDSYSTYPFGIYTFSFMLCAYLTTFIKMYIYQPGVPALRILLVFLISAINIVVQYFLFLMATTISAVDMFTHLLLPEVLATTIITTYAFRKFKQCALRLSV